MTVRVFVPADGSPAPGDELELDADESRYLLKVRRAQPGDPVELLDGRGGRWLATLRAAGRRARVEVGAPRPAPPEPAPRVVLLGLPEPAATLDALVGASELGATQVVLVRCARSQGHAPSAARIARVLRASLRQCGRPAAPELLGAPPSPAWDLARALAHRPELPGVFGQPRASVTAAPAPARVDHEVPGATGLRLLVGPEGGLREDEIEAARAAGFSGVNLGPWVLRTPTAVVAMLAHHVERAACEP
jgi:16S rRNA (uracil1498-N3)-methyltransferase